MKNRIGVYICQCGSNISDYVDVEKVKEAVSGDDIVILSKVTMFACADSTQKEIASDIEVQKLDGLVVASCSPKLHLDTFRNVAIRADLNPYNYVQVNIREQCSWAHSDKPKDATEKAIKLVLSGINRAKHSVALEKLKISSENTVIVVGAGIAGMRSAIELADMGSQVYLIEREHFVGGRTSQWNELFTTGESGRDVISTLYKEIKSHSNLTLFTGAEVVSKSGSVGDFNIQVEITPRFIKPDCKLDMDKFEKVLEICPVEVDDEFNFGLNKRKAIYKNFPSEFPEIPAIDDKNCTRCGECIKLCPDIDFEQKVETLNLKAGAILLTTGFDPYEPKEGEFGYKTVDSVITLQQMKRLIELNDNELIYNGKKINKIGYIYCVGSRQPDGENKYCSRYCCTSAIYTGTVVREKYKNIQNFHFNRGIRTYGKQELLYHEASESGDIFLQFYNESTPAVTMNGKGPKVAIEDFLTGGKEIEVDLDLLVLVTGMVPRKERKISDILKVPIGRDKFYNEIHPKLRPVETVIDGVHIAGACQSPKNITESVKSALSAAAKANSLISKGEIELEPTLAVIDKSICKSSGDCIKICPYDAITTIEHDGKTVSEVNKSSCKGCGMCIPVCPENAIQLIGYTDIEMESMIEALI